MDLSNTTQFLWGNITYIEYSVTHFYENLIISAIILLVGFIIAKLISKFAYRLLSEINANNFFSKITKVDLGFSEMISTLIYFIIVVISVLFALKQMSLTKVMINLVIVVVTILIVISSMISLIDIFPNLTAGILIQRKKMLKRGDEIVFKGTHGKVTEINLLETKILTIDGNLMVIPNSAFSKEEVRIIREQKEKVKNENK